jgi:hypothetical protein
VPASAFARNYRRTGFQGQWNTGIRCGYYGIRGALEKRVRGRAITKKKAGTSKALPKVNEFERLND